MIELPIVLPSQMILDRSGHLKNMETTADNQKANVGNIRL